jgi:hypothetical protein
MKKTTWMFTALTVSALALGGLAANATDNSQAQAPTAQAQNERATETPTGKPEAAKSVVGELTVFDANARTFAVKSDRATQNFVLSEGATVIAQGKSIPLSEVHVGSRVQVSYALQGTTMTATRLEVLG